MAVDLKKMMQVMQQLKDGDPVKKNNQQANNGDKNNKKIGNGNANSNQDDNSISVEDLQNWNRFQDFVKSKNMSGSKDLDVRDKKLGNQLIEAYNYYNPKNKINPDDVKKIQTELKTNYRGWLVDAMKKGYYVAPKGAGEDYSNFMKNLSQEDNWYGSITSKYSFDPDYIYYKKTGKMPRINDPKSLEIFKAQNEKNIRMPQE